MPKKKTKQQIMHSLNDYHNPFRLTDEEIARAEQLLDVIEKGEAEWMDSLQELVDILEVVPLAEHESAEEYNAAVTEDKEKLHQPIHVYQGIAPTQVMEDLSKELRFQRKHAMYRYMKECLQDCEDEEVPNYLAAFEDIAKNSDRPEVKESVAAVFEDYKREGRLPNLAVSLEDRVRTEADLINEFERPGWQLGYSIRDIERIAAGFEATKMKGWGRHIVSPDRDGHAVNAALNGIKRLDKRFQNDLQAMMALKSRDPKNPYNKLLELILEDLHLDKNPKELSVKEALKQEEFECLQDFQDALLDVCADIETHWSTEVSSEKERERQACGQALSDTLQAMEAYLDRFTREAPYDYILTENGNVDNRLAEGGRDKGEKREFYQRALNKWHRDKLERQNQASEKEEDSLSDESEKEDSFSEEPEEIISTSSKPEAENPNDALLKDALIQGEYYPEYQKYVEQKGDEGRKRIDSNDPKVLQQMISSKELDPLGDVYLQHRVNELARIDSLSAHAKPHKAPAVQPSKDGSIVLKAGQAETQTTEHGCWSVSLSTQLQYRGVDLNQTTIRAFRPSAEDFNAKELGHANADDGNTLENYTELVQKVLPDTAVNAFVSSPMEKQEEAEKYLRACVDRALLKDNAPLSITCGGHYRTIYGIQKDPNGDAGKDMLLFHDPSYHETKPISVKDFVDLCDVNRQSRKEGYETDPNYRYQYQFSASWLQDLQISEKGELGGDLQAQGFSYQDGELKHTGEYKTDAGTFRTFETGKLAPELPMPIVTYLPKKSFAKLQLEREQKEQQPVREEKNAQPVQEKEQAVIEQQPAPEKKQQIQENEQPAQEKKEEQPPEVKAEDISTSSKPAAAPENIYTGGMSEAPRREFDEAAARDYMNTLEQKSEILQNCFEAMLQTNTKEMWEKSSEEYKNMYNAFWNLKGGEGSFYDALKYMSTEGVRRELQNLYNTVYAYEHAKSKRLNRHSEVGGERLKMSRYAGHAIADILISANKADATCDDSLLQSFIDKNRKTDGRKKMDVEALRRKLGKDKEYSSKLIECSNIRTKKPEKKTEVKKSAKGMR